MCTRAIAGPSKVGATSVAVHKLQSTTQHEHDVLIREEERACWLEQMRDAGSAGLREESKRDALASGPAPAIPIPAIVSPAFTPHKEPENFAEGNLTLSAGNPRFREILVCLIAVRKVVNHLASNG